MSMRYKEEVITPEAARKLLQYNTSNRPIRQQHVANLAKDMKEGRWQVTHQGVAVALDGTLLDGQHRLHAVMESGRTVTMMVARGVDPDTYKVMDINKIRTHYDRTHLVDNQVDNKFICTLINSYIRCSQGLGTAIPVPMIDDEFLVHTDHWLWAARTLHVKRRGIAISPVLAAVVSYHIDSPGSAETFTIGLMEGLNLAAESPIRVLREALLAGRVDVKSNEAYWKTIGACRAHRDRKGLRNLVPSTEDFQGNRPERLLHEIQRHREKGAATLKAKNAAKKAGRVA